MHPTVTEAVFQHLRELSQQLIANVDDLGFRRRLLDEYFRLDGKSAEIVGEVKRQSCNGTAVEWVCAENSNSQRRILYIHGGSWISGTIEAYRSLASKISQASDAAVLTVDYRLAPEHKFPAGLDDCVRVYQWMLENGPNGAEPVEDAFVCGDSAGGNLTLSTLLRLMSDDKATPNAAVALSPATDFTGQSPSIKTKAAVDPVIPPMVYTVLPPIYLNDEALDNPFVSPLFGDFSRSPPILLQVGSAEILLDDSVRLADRAKQQGCDVQLQVWDGMPHVFQGFAPVLEPANQAISQIGEFIKSNIRTRSV